MNLRKLLLLFISFYLLQNAFAQDKSNSWIFGIGVNAVDYYPTNQSDMGGAFNELFNIEDHWNFFGLKLNADKILGNNFTIDGSFSINEIHKLGDSDGHNLMYYAFDGNLQYVFLGVDKKLQPYLYGGAGFNYVEYYKGGFTLNMGAGSNFWFGDNWGANLQAGFKYSNQNSDLLSHFFYAFGVVYRFGTYFNTKKFRWRNGL